MTLKQLFASALMASATLAQTDAEKTQYKDWHDALTQYGDYTWQPYKVTTDDGYILTTFRITGKEGADYSPTKPPVIMNHGLTGEAYIYLVGLLGTGLWAPTNKPWQLMLTDMGYDVWMTNNRGTQYSLQHETLSAQNPTYWNFSWAEMGVYDDPANIGLVKGVTGQKPYYIGHSQGTTQMLYGLAKEKQNGGTFFADNLQKAILLSTVTRPVTGSYEENAETLFKLPGLGITNMGGPNWGESLWEICSQMGSENCLSGIFAGGLSSYSVNQNIHYAQCGIEGRFQEYIPIDDYLAGNRQSDLIDITQIDQVPIVMFHGKDDTTAPYAIAVEISDSVPAVTSLTGFDGGHSVFSWYNGEPFWGNLVYELR